MTSPYDATRLLFARSGVLLFLAMASVLAYLTRHSLAVANTTIQAELQINNEQFGYLYSAFSFGYMLFQIPGGWVGQKLGVRFVLPAMAILWSLMTFASAYVPTFAGLLVIRFLFGLAQAGLVPNQALAVRDWISDAGRGVASAVMVVAMSVGSIASLSLTSELLKSFPWRSIFVGYSFLGVIWALAFAVVYRATPDKVRWLQRDEDELLDGPTDETEMSNATLPSSDSISTEAPVLSNGRNIETPSRPLTNMRLGVSLLGLSVQAMLKAAGYNLAVTFLPALLEYIHHVPPQQTGGYVTLALLLFIVGSMLGGGLLVFVFQVTGSKYISRSVIAAVMLAIAGLFTALAGYGETANATAIWLAVGAFFSGLASAAPWVAVMDIGGRSTAVIMGFMNSFAALGGVLLSPLLGRLIDHIKDTEGDWSLVFLLHGAYYLVAAISWLLVDPNQSLESKAGSAADGVGQLAQTCRTRRN